MRHPPTALIADDEPLLREALARRLAEAWPALTVVAQARNGREAVELFETFRPEICFLDIQMPGISATVPISSSSPPSTTTRSRPSPRESSIIS
jgi:YesN/AraC family two-component response regulator